MPECIMLIGLPGSGKSTWRSKHLTTNPDKNFFIHSLDDLIDQFAAENGMTYSQAWNKFDMKGGSKMLDENFLKAVAAKQDIIIDMTNMSEKSRKGKLKKLTEDYTKSAVVFVVPDNVLQERLKKRAEETGKSIPPFVVNQMARSYQAPTKAEFDRITYVK